MYYNKDSMPHFAGSKKLLTNKYEEISVTLDLSNLPESYKEILQAQNFEHIHTLIMSRNNIDDDSISSFTFKNWQHLTKLDLSENRLRPLGLKKLVPKNFGALTQLNLSCSRLGCCVSKMLVKISMPNLQKLCLNSCFLGTVGLQYLVKGRWNKIYNIDLSYNSSNIEGYEKVSETNWVNLQYLHLHKPQYFEEPICCMGLISACSKEMKIHDGLDDEVDLNILRIWSEKTD